MTTEKARCGTPVPELAQKLGLSAESVYRGIRQKQIPHLRVGRRLILPKAAVDHWLATAGVEAH